MGAARRLVDDPDASAQPPGQPAAEPDDDAFSSEPARRLVDDPARVTHVLVRGAGPMPSTADAERLKARVRAIYEAFSDDHAGQVPDVFSIRIQTWEDQNRTMIQAVRKETAVVLFIFSFISLTAVFLTLAIFWSMISEKTRDIGVLRALGAGRAGVAALWIGYGLLIGVVGSLLGLGLAYAIVLNINPIHDWLGQALGIVVWDPRIYYFVKIPSRVEPDKALIVLVGGILSCAVGAAWPAIRAATMHPVRALRFE
jgi:lipoprotein-releasing system permease protein